ncbi:MAG: hypothetical protein R3Y32_03140 [Bacillota bacterium]
MNNCAKKIYQEDQLEALSKVELKKLYKDQTIKTKGFTFYANQTQYDNRSGGSYTNGKR